MNNREHELDTTSPQSRSRSNSHPVSPCGESSLSQSLTGAVLPSSPNAAPAYNQDLSLSRSVDAMDLSRSCERPCSSNDPTVLHSPRSAPMLPTTRAHKKPNRPSPLGVGHSIRPPNTCRKQKLKNLRDLHEFEKNLNTSAPNIDQEFIHNMPPPVSATTADSVLTEILMEKSRTVEAEALPWGIKDASNLVWPKTHTKKGCWQFCSPSSNVAAVIYVFFAMFAPFFAPFAILGLTAYVMTTACTRPRDMDCGFLVRVGTLFVMLTLGLLGYCNLVWGHHDAALLFSPLGIYFSLVSYIVFIAVQESSSSSCYFGRPLLQLVKVRKAAQVLVDSEGSASAQASFTVACHSNPAIDGFDENSESSSGISEDQKRETVKLPRFPENVPPSPFSRECDSEVPHNALLRTSSRHRRDSFVVMAVLAHSDNNATPFSPAESSNSSTSEDDFIRTKDQQVQQVQQQHDPQNDTPKPQPESRMFSSGLVESTSRVCDQIDGLCTAKAIETVWHPAWTFFLYGVIPCGVAAFNTYGFLKTWSRQWVHQDRMSFVLDVQFYGTAASIFFGAVVSGVLTLHALLKLDVVLEWYRQLRSISEHGLDVKGDNVRWNFLRARDRQELALWLSLRSRFAAKLSVTSAMCGPALACCLLLLPALAVYLAVRILAISPHKQNLDLVFLVATVDAIVAVAWCLSLANVGIMLSEVAGENVQFLRYRIGRLRESLLTLAEIIDELPSYEDLLIKEHRQAVKDLESYLSLLEVAASSMRTDEPVKVLGIKLSTDLRNKMIGILVTGTIGVCAQVFTTY